MLVKFLNKFIKKGKKNNAENMLLRCFVYLKFVSRKSSQNLICRAIRNASPDFEVISKRVGGSFYKIPFSTSKKNPRRKLFLGISNINKCMKMRKENSFLKKIALEILDSSLNKGFSVSYCKKMHEESFNNRAFLTYSFKK